MYKLKCVNVVDNRLGTGETVRYWIQYRQDVVTVKVTVRVTVSNGVRACRKVSPLELAFFFLFGVCVFKNGTRSGNSSSM